MSLKVLYAKIFTDIGVLKKYPDPDAAAVTAVIVPFQTLTSERAVKHLGGAVQQILTSQTGALFEPVHIRPSTDKTCIKSWFRFQMEVPDPEGFRAALPQTLVN